MHRMVYVKELVERALEREYPDTLTMEALKAICSSYMYDTVRRACNDLTKAGRIERIRIGVYRWKGEDQ